MFCNECGTKHPRYDNYCTTAGAVLQPKLKGRMKRSSAEFCSGCGGKVSATGAYCHHCGLDQSTYTLQAAQSFIPHLQKPEVNMNLNMNMNVQGISVEKFKSPEVLRTALMSALLAIVLVMISALVAQNFLESAVLTAINEEEGTAYTKKELRKLSMITEGIVEETGIKVSVPKIYGVTTFISLFHNVKMSFDAKAGDSDFFELAFNLKNVAAAGMVVPIIFLLLAGLLLGYFTKQRQISLLEPLLVFSGAYAVFVAISAFLAGWKFKHSFTVFYQTISIKAGLSFSFFGALVTAFLLALIVGGIAAFAIRYGKQSFALLNQKAAIMQYATYSVLSLVGMLVVFAVITIFAVSKNDLGAGGSMDGIITVIEVLVSAYAAVWMLNLSHFNSLAFQYGQNSDVFSIDLHLFSSVKSVVDKLGESYEAAEFLNSFVLVDSSFPLFMKMGILIPIAVLIFIGYKLFHSPQQQIKQILTFAGVYTAIMVIFTIMSKMSFAVTQEYVDINVSFYSPIIGTAITTFLLCAVSVAVGAFLKGKRSSAI